MRGPMLDSACVSVTEQAEELSSSEEESLLVALSRDLDDHGFHES